MRDVRRWKVAAWLVALAGAIAVAAGPPPGTGPRAVIVDDSEPGEPLVVSGTIYAPDGETPVQGATVYVYQTDRNGVYDKTGDELHPYRIGGWMATAADGRYEFRTIRPGSYPRQRVPAHIHYEVDVGDGRKQRFELRFEGDPYLSARQIESSRAAGRFAVIRSVTRDPDGTLRCEHDIRLRD